jgi:hypothetical protein
VLENKGFNPKWSHPVWVVVLPIAYVIIYLLVGNPRGPYYWTPNQDPDYAYLGNSLVLALLRVPQHTDHPGTPLQALGAIVLWLSYLIQLPFNPTLKKNLADEVLTRPELYLNLFNYMLLFVTACALVAVGWVALRLTRSLLLTLILQITPLLLIRTFLAEEPSRVAPDVLVVCISQLMVLVLVRYLYSENEERSRHFIISLGAVFGLGMATKVTFLPMILFFLLPYGWRRKALALGAAVAAFVLATLPIITRYGRTFGWMTGLAIHTGPYGGGEVGLVDASSLGSKAEQLFTRNLVFFTILLIATAASIGFAILWRLRGNLLQDQGRASRDDTLQELNSHSSFRPDFRKVYFLLAITTLVTWGQVVLTLKQQPQSRYLNPAAGLMGFLVFLLIHVALMLLPIVIARRIARRIEASRLKLIVPAIALALCVAISIQQIDYAENRIASQAQRRLKELTKIEAILQKDEYKSCAKVVSRRASTPESALKFGDFWTGKKLQNFLGNLYPDPVFYIDEEKGYETYTQPVSLATLNEKGKGCVLLEINSMPLTDWKAKYRPKQGVDKIFEGRLEALYRIKTN